MSDPITLAAAGLASFSHINNIVKTFFEARDRAINLEQVNALQSEIASIYAGYLALQQQAFALAAEKDNLKKEIASFETWNNEAERYKLVRVRDSVFAYALKESHANGEPPHWLCANCYNKRIKGFVTKYQKHIKSRECNCSNCNFSMFTGSEPKYAEYYSIQQTIENE